MTRCPRRGNVSITTPITSRFGTTKRSAHHSPELHGRYCMKLPLSPCIVMFCSPCGKIALMGLMSQNSTMGDCFINTAASRSPELFELPQAPTGWDSATNSVKAGRDRLTLFPGAKLAFQELSSQEKFSNTEVAVASATTRKSWALECLRLLEVSFYYSFSVSRREIYVG